MTTSAPATVRRHRRRLVGDAGIGYLHRSCRFVMLLARRRLLRPGDLQPRPLRQGHRLRADELAGSVEEANLGLSCGNPTAIAALSPVRS